MCHILLLCTYYCISKLYKAAKPKRRQTAYMNHRHMRFEASWKDNAVSRAIRSILIWLAGWLPRRQQHRA